MKVIFELLKILPLLALLVGATLLVGCGRQSDSDLTILNVSYDPTRELYKEYNEAFVQHWKREDGPDGHGRAVARRVGQAGPAGDQRFAGLGRHAGPGLRHRH